MGVKYGLPAIARADARLFVLGSLPGDASLVAKRYYAHPTNQFWRLLGSAIGEDLQALSYSDRLVRLAERRDRPVGRDRFGHPPGSLDQAIREAQHNQIEHLLHDFPDLRAIAFNGSDGRGSRPQADRSSAPAHRLDRPAVIERRQYPAVRRQGSSLVGAA